MAERRITIKLAVSHIDIECWADIISTTHKSETTKMIWCKALRTHKCVLAVKKEQDNLPPYQNIRWLVPLMEFFEESVDKRQKRRKKGNNNEMVSGVASVAGCYIQF